MPEEFIVLMEKDLQTGEFIKEYGVYSVSCFSELLYSAHCFHKEDELFICLNLTINSSLELTDDDFNCVFDCYESDGLLPFVESFSEIENCYNPTWSVVFKADEQNIEKQIINILEIHAKELEQVFALLFNE